MFPQSVGGILQIFVSLLVLFVHQFANMTMISLVGRMSSEVDYESHIDSDQSQGSEEKMGLPALRVVLFLMGDLARLSSASLGPLLTSMCRLGLSAARNIQGSTSASCMWYIRPPSLLQV